MENMNPKIDKSFQWMIYGSLMILALGLLTSMSALALSHILIVIPGIYFIFHADYKNFPVSAWAMLALVVVLICSIIFNQDIAINGFKPISKVKYFLLGFLALAPLCWYFKKYSTDKKISWLIYALCVSATFATIAGLIGLYSGYNPILMKAVHPTRNSGLFGMLMNYAHNLSYFLTIVAGLLIYRRESKKWVNINFLVIVFVINLIGFYYTYTRGTWLGFLCAIPFYYLKAHKKLFFRLGLGLFVVGIVAYFMAGDKVIRPQSEVERISQWKAAVMAFKERPVLGYGYLNFEPHSGEIKTRYELGSVTFVSHAHSNIFEMLGSGGLLGIAVFLIWIGAWFREMYKGSHFMCNIGLAFIVTFFVGGLTQSTITLGINLFFVLAAWCLCSTERALHSSEI